MITTKSQEIFANKRDFVLFQALVFELMQESTPRILEPIVILFRCRLITAEKDLAASAFYKQAPMWQLICKLFRS